MEKLMPAMSRPVVRDSRLRFVFSDTVVSCRIAADMTLGEIASRCGEVSDRLTRDPVAVDVTLGVPRDNQLRGGASGSAAALALRRWPVQP